MHYELRNVKTEKRKHLIPTEEETMQWKLNISCEEDKQKKITNEEDKQKKKKKKACIRRRRKHAYEACISRVL